MSSRDTERVFDGHAVLGPYIEAEAYAAYAEGSYQEKQGHTAAAEQAYRRALREDPDNAGIWTRLGVIACPGDLRRALEAFEHALAIPGYAPAWAERASCLHQHGQTKPALESALRAVMLSPKDPGANLLLVQIYREQGQLAAARAWLLAWTLYSPEVASRWADVQREAALSGDVALARSARAELEARRRQADVPEPSANAVSAGAASAAAATRAAPESVVAAIWAGDLARARVAAAERSVSALDLALIAAALGKPELALAQAELIVTAAPDDGEALIAALGASALANDEPALARLLRQARGVKPARPAVADLMTSLLRWRVGDEAAESWNTAYRDSRAAPAPDAAR
jgi:tetratricopeptide (TPR) repeat protein